MTPDQDKILARVRKMLALANDAGATEGERDNAMRMAHAALIRHNLTEAHVAMELDQRVKDHFDASEEWTIRAAQGIAGLFFCRFYFQRRRDRQGAPWYLRHTVIGRPANVATALMMAQFAIDSIRKEAKALKGNASILSFCNGAADTISRRCFELRKKPDGEAVTAPGTSVVLADYYKTEESANTEYLRKEGTRVKTGIVIGNRSEQEAYAAGKAFGASLNLNAQVGQSDQSPRLLGGAQ